MISEDRRELLERALAGRLDSAQQVAWESSLAEDAALRAEWIRRRRARREVPAALLEQGFRAGLDSAESFRSHPLLRGAGLAAALLAAVAGSWWWSLRPVGPTPSEAVRSSSPVGATVPTLLEPKAGAEAAVVDLWQWTAVTGALSYRLRILDSSGDLVTEVATDATAVRSEALDLTARSRWAAWYVEVRWPDRQPTASAVSYFAPASPPALQDSEADPGHR